MLDVIYRATRGRLADLFAGLGDEQLRTRVPATPDWTVHEVLAHVVGGAADLAAERLDGAPGDEWTARHVAERRSRPVPRLLDEWDTVAPAVESSLVGQEFTGPNLAADLICHEADVHEALGLGRVAREHWQRPFLVRLMALLGLRLKDGPALVVRDETGREWRCGAGDPVTTLNADGYELLRAMFSRRSRRQITAWDWSSTPAEAMIAGFGVFGARDDDQPAPPA